MENFDTNEGISLRVRIKKEFPLFRVGDEYTFTLDYEIYKFIYQILTVKDLINLGFLEIV